MPMPRPNLEHVSDTPHYPDDTVFGLRAQIAHRQAEFADGYTMADVVADLDLFRGEPTNAVAVLAICRAEYDARIDERYGHLWRRS